MKTRFLLLGIGSLVLAGCAMGPSQHEIHSECRLEMDAARTAVQLRNKGKDKLAMLRTLPPLHKNSTRLLHQMYQIVDETYDYPHLNDIVFGIYRYELCARELRRQPVPTDIGSVHMQLQSCQARFHRQVSKQAVDCVRAVFPKKPTKDTDKTNAEIITIQ
ncbi:MAG: hypothetical protein P8Z75_00765 [Gammaproteobacteria bacterium]|jgi:hypothetical protein